MTTDSALAPSVPAPDLAVLRQQLVEAERRTLAAGGLAEATAAITDAEANAARLRKRRQQLDAEASAASQRLEAARAHRNERIRALHAQGVSMTLIVTESGLSRPRVADIIESSDESASA